MLRAEQVLQEILVALAARAQKIRAPDEEIAREVPGVVRVLAAHLEGAGFQLRRDVVRRFLAGTGGVLCERQRIRLELGRRRQPAHALGADVEVDEAALERALGERREDLADAKLLVAPLARMRVEERGRVHLARRAVPVEREGDRLPAGLRAQLLLADIVRPAAAGL